MNKDDHVRANPTGNLARHMRITPQLCEAVVLLEGIFNLQDGVGRSNFQLGQPKRERQW